MPRGELCEFGGGLFRTACGREAVSECVYCGRPFCEWHGERGPDFADVCSRRACRAKQRDLAEHLAWRERSRAANATAVCAQEQCQERMRHECSQCRLQFCAEHVSEASVVSRRTEPPRRVLAVVCSHCLQRRKLWD